MEKKRLEEGEHEEIQNKKLNERWNEGTDNFCWNS